MMPSLLYEPDERPPYAFAFGLSFQRAMLMGPSLALIPTIIMRAANQDEIYLSWTIFALLMVTGAITIVQTLRIGRFGSGYVLVMGTSSAFIGVCIGIVFFALAFLPKVMAVLIAIPSPVAAAYLTVLAVTQRFSPCAGERKEVFGEGDCCLRILYVSSSGSR